MNAIEELKEKAKLALKITTTDFDAEISDIVNACLLDLGLAGVENVDTQDALIIRAVCTFARFSWGSPADYDKLKASYNEQKAQMGMASGYTNFEG